MCFFVFLIYNGKSYSYIWDGENQENTKRLESSRTADNDTTGSEGANQGSTKPEMTVQKRPQRTGKRYCVPHADLEKQHGLPGPCNDSMLVLDCPDPYLEYLHDPQVLHTCRVKIDSKFPERRKQIIKESGSVDCHNMDGVLVSNSTLPVSPKPQPIPGKVPRIIHYVSLSCNRIFTFSNYLSILSVHRFIKPGRIYFHGDCTPKGPWWERTTDEIPNIYFRERGRTKLIQGKPPMWIEHETDIIRLQVLLGKKHSYD